MAPPKASGFIFSSHQTHSDVPFSAHDITEPGPVTTNQCQPLGTSKACTGPTVAPKVGPTLPNYPYSNIWKVTPSTFPAPFFGSTGDPHWEHILRTSKPCPRLAERTPSKVCQEVHCGPKGSSGQAANPSAHFGLAKETLQALMLLLFTQKAG